MIARLSADLRRSDLLVLAAYAVVSGVCGYLSLESPLTTPWWSLVALFVAGVASTLGARRHPTAAFAAVLVLLPASFAVGSGAEAVLAVVGLFRSAVLRPPRQAWAAFSLVIGSAAVASLLLAFRVRLGPPLLGLAPRADVAGWPLDGVSILAMSTGVALIATLVGLDVGHRRREVARLRDRAEQLRRERDQEAHLAAAAERERIAREMHDVIAHSLAVMIAVADGAEASAASRPDESRRAIARVAETGRRTLGEMRRLLTTVREDGSGSPLPAGAPRADRIPALVDEARAAGLPVRLEQTGALADDAVIGLTVYRIVQEALTNILRHGRDVREALVRLVIDDRAVTILVEDRSAPSAPSDDPGRGLVGIRERAAFYDGSVEAGPRSGGGWRLFVRLRREDR